MTNNSLNIFADITEIQVRELPYLPSLPPQVLAGLYPFGGATDKEAIVTCLRNTTNRENHSIHWPRHDVDPISWLLMHLSDKKTDVFWNGKDFSQIVDHMTKLKPNAYAVALLRDSLSLLISTCVRNQEIDGINRLQDIALPNLILAQARWALLPPISILEACRDGMVVDDDESAWDYVDRKLGQFRPGFRWRQSWRKPHIHRRKGTLDSEPLDEWPLHVRRQL